MSMTDIITSGGTGGITTLTRNSDYSVDRIILNGNALSMNENYFDFSYDDKIFEYVSFDSNYGFKYDFNEKKVLGDDVLKLNTERGAYSWIFESNNNSGVGLTILWSVKLKVRDDAPLGNTIINGKKYIIECSEDDKECNNIEENKNIDDNKSIGANNLFDNTQFLILASMFILIFIELFILIIINAKNRKSTRNI